MPSKTAFSLLAFSGLVVAGIILWSGCGSQGGEQAPPEEEPGVVRFTDVTAAAGLGNFLHHHAGWGDAWAPEINGGGGGFLDYDGDGWIDLALVPGGAFRGQGQDTLPALRLYRNRGDGTFEDRTREAGFYEHQTYGYGIAFGDYDNDGDEDIFLSSLYRDLLFRNDGGGVFSEVGLQAGFQEEENWGESAMFFDADRDGWLDVYVVNYVVWSPETDIYCAHEGQKVYCTPQEYPGQRSRYFRNNGDGTFSDWTERAGFAAGIEEERDKALGVTELDYNQDGWPDVMVTNDTERDLLYENNGDGTFTERGIMAGIAYNANGNPRAGMGIDVGATDASGETTIVIGHFTEESIAVYRHVGNGLFMDRAAAAKIGHASLMTLTFGVILFDVDLDSDLDLLTANGHVQTHIAKLVHGVSFRQEPQLYLNDGNSTFTELQLREDDGLNEAKVARAVAHADFDRDGDLDVLYVENNGPAHLLRNDTEGGGYVRIKPIGTKSNRSAIGTQVDGWMGDRRLVQRVRSGSSYLTQFELAATFGLAEAEQLDSVLVRWPSGRRDRFENVKANQLLRIVEGTGRLEPWTPGESRDSTP